MKFGPREILMISYLDYPYPAGLSSRIDGLGDILTRNEVRVNILAQIARGGFQERNQTDRFLVERIDLRRFGRDSSKLGTRILQLMLFSVIASFKVAKKAIRSRPLIQFQSVYSAIPALLAKIFLRAKIIADDIVLIHPLVNIPVLKLSDFIVTPSRSTYTYAKRLGKSALYVPNGVNQGLKKKPRSDRETDILFVGSLSFYQNLKAAEKITRIASTLDSKGLRFHITIVGGPLSYAEHLVNHPMVKKGKVTFVGMMPHNELKKVYSSSSIGLLPFFKDTPLTGGQRTKALEFFANHLLVISGPEGIKGIAGLEPRKHYLLADSVKEMSAILEKCLKDYKRYKGIREVGARYVSSNYSWEAVSREYVTLINNLAARSQNSIPRKSTEAPTSR